MVSIRTGQESVGSQGGVVGLARTVLTTSGPMALLALALSGFLGWAVWGRLDRIDIAEAKILAEISTANVRMGAFVAAHEQLERERSLLLQSQVRILRQLCVNAAKSDAQIRSCVSE